MNPVRPHINFIEKCLRNFDKRVRLSFIDTSALYKDSNWKWVNEFNYIDYDGVNFYVHFGFIYIGPGCGSTFVPIFTMPTDYKLKNERDMMELRKNILIYKFAEAFENMTLEDCIDFIDSTYTSEYVKTPYSTGGNLE